MKSRIYTVIFTTLLLFTMVSCENAFVPSDRDIQIATLALPQTIHRYAANDHYIVVNGLASVLYIWDWDDLSQFQKMNPDKPAFGVLLDDQSLLLYLYSGKDTLYLYDTFLDKVIRQWPSLTKDRYLHQSANSRNGKYVVLVYAVQRGKRPDLFTVISTETGDELDWRDAQERYIYSGETFAVSNNGRYVVVSPYIYDTQTNHRHELEQVSVWDKYATEVSITPDSQRVFCGGWTRKAVGAYDLATGKLLHEYELNIKSHNKYPIVGTDVSPDGRWLVASTYEPDLIHLWDLRTDQKVGLWKGTVQNITFAPDSQRFAALSRVTGEIHIYKIPDALLSSVK